MAFDEAYSYEALETPDGSYRVFPHTSQATGRTEYHCLGLGGGHHLVGWSTMREAKEHVESFDRHIRGLPEVEPKVG